MVPNDAKDHQIEELLKLIFPLPFECFINHHWRFTSELHAASWKHHSQYPVFPKQSWKRQRIPIDCECFSGVLFVRWLASEFNYSPIRWTATTPHRVCARLHHSAVIQFYWNCSSFIFPSGGKIAEWTQYSDPDPAGIKPIRSLMCQNSVPSRGAFDYPSGRWGWFFLAHAWPN